MKRLLLIYLVIFFFCSTRSYSQTDEQVVLETGSGALEGTLLIPSSKRKLVVALIIAGSGPTDRNGNNSMMKNNSLKLLASGLATNGIASLRYDKRGVGSSKGAAKPEIDLRFDDYINDARLWIALLQKEKRFKKIIVIGHSEGSLIGIITSQESAVTKYISIAGLGGSAPDVIREQLSAQPPIVLEMAEPILKELEQGRTTEDVPIGLYSLFRPSVQPYMISWFSYDPAEEIKKLSIPILIINGTTDIQVSPEQAQVLAQANPKAEKKIIEGMNHVLKEAEMDRQKNIATYNNPDLPLAPRFIEAIVRFIDK